MENKMVKIQLIANYFNSLRTPLLQKGVNIESIIDGCNPLAMVGMKQTKKTPLAEKVNYIPTQLVAKGNLCQMLSHSEDNFCSNQLLQEIGQELRYKNGTDYIVVCNNLCGYNIHLCDNVVYSDTSPNENAFKTALLSDASKITFGIPYPEFFDWKTYYHKFIDTIMGEYDSDHIILIRTNSARWYLNGYGIEQLGNDNVTNTRYLVEQMDELFAEKTNCLCVNLMYGHIPVENSTFAFRYMPKTELMFNEVKLAIVDIVNGNTEKYRQKHISFNTPFIRRISDLFNRDFGQKYADILETADKKRCCKVSDMTDNAVFADMLSRLERFIVNGRKYTISDYIADIIKSDVTADHIALLELALRNMKLGMDEIAAVYKLYLTVDKKSCLKGCISAILENPDCYPINYTKEVIKRNTDFLSSYKYIESALLNAPSVHGIIRLDNGNLLCLDAKNNEPMRIIETGVKKTVDPNAIIDNGYVCDIREAEALASNWRFYISRARNGKGGSPVTIHFDSAQDFALSLAYIDYAELLESEPYIINCENDLNSFSLNDYAPRTDLSFLFEKNVSIYHISSGFADQIIYYTFSRRLREIMCGKVYYDDLFRDSKKPFEGNYIDKYVTEDLNSMLLSNVFSPMLKKSYSGLTVADMLYNNGFTNIVGITNNHNRFEFFKSCARLFLPENKIGKFKDVVNNFIPYYACWVLPLTLMEENRFKLTEYIRFSMFDDDDPNKAVFDKMNNSDSVVLHVRRGDFVTWGWDIDDDYYRESLQKLKSIKDYHNKKFFVFSDDIKWCKKNMDKIIYEVFPHADITFVDYNKGADSYKDLQLISNGKIIIGCMSGMSRTAILLSENCEIQMFPLQNELDALENHFRKSKYDIGKYSRSYKPDIAARKPKSEQKK